MALLTSGHLLLMTAGKTFSSIILWVWLNFGSKALSQG
jgi:hypothetical protein